MLQLATAPDRPRPALLASIGIHAMAFSVFGFAPLLAFPQAPGWEGAVWVVTQPKLAPLHRVTPVDLGGPAPENRPAAGSGGGPLPAARPDGPPAETPSETSQPGPILDELPTPPDSEASWGPGVPGGIEDGTGLPPGNGTTTGGGGGDDRPIDVREGLPPGIELPVPLQTPSPRYPDSARIARLQGAVVLEATIAADGSVGNVTVERGVTPLLDLAAVEAVSRWRYRPARVDGSTVAVILRVTITFRLD